MHTRTTRDTCCNIALAAILAGLAALSGCAVFEPDPARNALGWHHNPAYPQPMATVVWETVPLAQLAPRCANPPHWGGQACAIRFRQTGTCVVLSVHTEDAARRAIAADGMTVWAHEKRHCDGEDHTATTVWSMTAAQGVVR